MKDETRIQIVESFVSVFHNRDLGRKKKITYWNGYLDALYEHEIINWKEYEGWLQKGREVIEYGLDR